MKPFLFYIPPETLKRLEALAKKDKVSVGELIREGVKRILEEREHE